MAASSMTALSPAHHGGGSSRLSGVGDSSDTGAGVAAPAFGLLPLGDMHQLQRLMSDEIEQLRQLHSVFDPCEQLQSGRFWRLAADCLGKPLEAVMLSGMFLRSEADKEWERLQQQKQQAQAGRVPQPDEGLAAQDGAGAAMLFLKERPQPELTQQEPEPEQQPADEEQQDEAAEEEAAALLAGLAEAAAATEQHGAQPAAEVMDAAARLQGSAEAAAAEPAAPAPLKLLDLPGDVLRRIFTCVPLSDRLTQLRCVNRQCLGLVDQLGLSGSCLCFDVSVLQKERTSKYLQDVRELLARALPEHQQLSVLIKRLPSARSSLRLVEQLESDAQVRLVVRQPVQDMRHRLRCLPMRPLRKLALEGLRQQGVQDVQQAVDTERLPSHLLYLAHLESLSWEGEGPFEDPDVAGEWGRALASLQQLTYLRWQPRPPPPGAPAWRVDKWDQLSTSPAVLAGMARLHTLVWLPPRAVEALPDGAYLNSLRHLALPAQLAERSLPQLGQAAELRTLCLTGWEAVCRVQRIVDVVRKLPKLERFAYNCAPAAMETAAAVAAAVAAMGRRRPDLWIEDSSGACLAALRDHN